MYRVYVRIKSYIYSIFYMKDELNMFNRLTKDEYFIEIAKSVAKRSTCLRRHYGAIIVKDDQIISTGYNGSAVGDPNCIDTRKCARQLNGVAHGERYDLCVAVHAEENAIMQAGRLANNATLYLAGFEEDGSEISHPKPCIMCERLIKNAKISKIVTINDLEKCNSENVKNF